MNKILGCLGFCFSLVIAMGVQAQAPVLIDGDESYCGAHTESMAQSEFMAATVEEAYVGDYLEIQYKMVRPTGLSIAGLNLDNSYVHPVAIMDGLSLSSEIPLKGDKALKKIFFSDYTYYSYRVMTLVPHNVSGVAHKKMMIKLAFPGQSCLFAYDLGQIIFHD